MTEQAKAARRAYKRQWARANPDKIRAQQERYWTRKAAEAAALQGDDVDAEKDGEEGPRCRRPVECVQVGRSP